MKLHSPSSRKTAKKLLVVLTASLITLTAVFMVRASISISTSTAYTQNFDAIGTSATATLPADFKVDKQSSVRTVGTYAAAGTATERVGGANLSTSAANGIYNFSSGTTTTGADRAVGFLSSGTGTTSGNLYAQLVNNTGGSLSGLTISYDVEKYRNGSNASGFRIQMFYSTDGASWTSAGSDFFTSFAADANNNGFATAPGATSSVSNKTLNVAIANGSNFYLAWNYSVTTGTTVTNAQALAVDNISILGISTPVSTNPTVTGSATPNSLPAGGSTLLTATVTPGANPTSTGLQVKADLTAIGGSATQQLFDDGLHGDGAANDNVFAFTATVGNLTTPGNKSLPVTVTDAQGRSGSTTIALTVQPPTLAIHDIQGSGTTSPFANLLVNTTGIVTGIKSGSSGGFFIQVPDANVDADPNSSEGIFVFTGSSIPAAAAIGNLISVTGKVQEFVPSADPNSPPVTEIGSSPTVSLVSTGNSLPAPVVLTAAITQVNDLNNLEKYEGMRVHVDSLTVVGPTQGTISEANATSTSNGVFYGVVTGVDRPFREPGIQVPDPVPAPPPANVPRFDGNPERLRVDSDAQPGTTPIDVTAGAVVTNLTGPLDYSFRTYTILPDAATHPSFSGNISATPVPPVGEGEFTVASFNMERFFDTTNDPSISDVALTPTAFNNRLNKASLAVRNIMRTPDIIGVEEMENLATLQAVADKINGDAMAAGDPNPNYQPYLLEGNDIGGIDVGFLVKASRVTVIDVTQVGKGTTFTQPDNTQALLNDRPSLILRATIQPPNGDPFPVTVIVNHLRSLSGVDDPTDGPRVRAKRRAQAEFLANLIQARQAADPTEHIISVGDYNAFQFNDGYVDVMGTVKGTPTPADQVVLASPDLVNPDLTDLVDTVPADQRYSFNFDGNAQELDHILITSNLLARVDGLHYARNNSDFPESYRSDPNRPERISDHDMLVAYFSFPKADLSISKSPATSSPEAGSTISYTITVTNSMDDAATNVVMTDTLPPHTTFNSISTPQDWNCTTPNAGDTGTISCTAPTLASNATAVFTVTLNVDCAVANGTQVSNTASVASDTFDPDQTNNSSMVTVTISNPPPVISNVSVDQAVLWPANHKMVDVTVNYTAADNCTPANAIVCQLTVSSNEPVNGTGDGDTAPDWIVVDAHHVQLRAERAGNANGRTYTITITCVDSGGNSSSTTTTVSVPHDLVTK